MNAAHNALDELRRRHGSLANIRIIAGGEEVEISDTFSAVSSSTQFRELPHYDDAELTQSFYITDELRALARDE